MGALNAAISKVGGQVNSHQRTASPEQDGPLGVAVVGAGYWGPNLVRNFRGSPLWDLVAVCDRDIERAQKAIGNRSTVEVMGSLDEVLDRDDIDAVAIATP